MTPAFHITLEDLLACWRAAVAHGGDADEELAAEIALAIAREAAFTRGAPDAALAGDKSLASAAERFRSRAPRSAPALSNPNDLRALSAVAAALASVQPRQTGAASKKDCGHDD